LGLCAKRSGPRPVDRAVDGDPVQPRTERAAVVEAVERAHGRKEGLLRDVLRGCGVVDDEIRGAVGAGPMLAKEGLEVRDRSSLSAPDPRALAPGEARHRALTIRANSLTRSIRRRDLARSNARISGSPRKEPAVKRLAVLLAFAFLPTALAHAATANGRTLAFAATPDRSTHETRFVLVDGSRGRVTRNFSLRGSYQIDAVAPGGRRVFLIHWRRNTYDLLTYDVGTRRLAPTRLAEPDEKMHGTASGAIATRD